MASEYSALMNCAHIRPLLSAYADKETTEVESALIKRHLACCSSCASELAFAQAMNTSLFTMPLSVPPPDLFEAALVMLVPVARVHAVHLFPRVVAVAPRLGRYLWTGLVLACAARVYGLAADA
jgi:predicted anti-sigma-YlaC factor YlaD